MSESENHSVKVGQIWQDRDWRVKDRFVRVIDIKGDSATCQRCDRDGKSLTHRVTSILLRRFRPTSTGYDLMEHP